MRKSVLPFLIALIILACGSSATVIPTVDDNFIQTAIALTAVQANALTQNADQPTVSIDTGKWVITTDTSPIDDSQTVVLKLPAEERIQGWLDTFLPVLFIRCKEHEVDIYIYTGTASAVENDIDHSTIRLRFDSDPALTVKMNHSTDDEALFFQQEYLQSVVDAILTHEIMLFEFTPFNASPDNTTFDLRGVNEAVKPLQKACE
jgi:type VI secretion system protein VasI